jgi:hypothetical protein
LNAENPSPKDGSKPSQLLTCILIDFNFQYIELKIVQGIFQSLKRRASLVRTAEVVITAEVVTLTFPMINNNQGIYFKYT